LTKAVSVAVRFMGANVELTGRGPES